MQSSALPDWVIAFITLVSALLGGLYAAVIRPIVARIDRLEDEVRDDVREDSTKRGAIYAEIKAILSRLHALEVRFAEHLKRGRE